MSVGRIGLRLHDAAAGTLRERAGFARAQGFTCVHLALSKTLGKEYMAPGVLTPGLAAQVVDDMNGLDIAVLGCYLNLATPDEDDYRAVLKKYIAHLRFAMWARAGVVGTETGNPNKEYRYDPEKSHTDEALAFFIERLRPVVRAAETLGAVLAIEPVFTHIVCDGKRARRVLDEIDSPNLGIILDPVNLLHESNCQRADQVIGEAIDLLHDDVLVVHMKDYVIADDGRLRSVAAGTGRMDFTAVAEFVRREKPSIQLTLEDTRPDNAEQARRFVDDLLSRA